MVTNVRGVRSEFGEAESQRGAPRDEALSRVRVDFALVVTFVVRGPAVFYRIDYRCRHAFFTEVARATAKPRRGL